MPMKQLFCGSRTVRHVRCDKCGLNMSYNKIKGQDELVCIKCGNHIQMKKHKY